MHPASMFQSAHIFATNQLHCVFVFIIQVGYTFRPYNILQSSWSYRFGLRVQHIWQLVIDKWYTNTHTHTHTYVRMTN